MHNVIATERAAEIANDCQELRLADYAKLKGLGIAAAGASGAAPAQAAAGAGGGFGAAKPAFGTAGGGFGAAGGGGESPRHPHPQSPHVFAGLTHVDLWVPVAGASVKLASLPADAPSWSIVQVR